MRARAAGRAALPVQATPLHSVLNVTANALADAIVAAMKSLDREDEFELMARPDGERWALRPDEKRVMHG